MLVPDRTQAKEAHGLGGFELRTQEGSRESRAVQEGAAS